MAIPEHDDVRIPEDFRTRDDLEAAERGRARDEAVLGADSGPDDPRARRAADGLTVSERDAASYREHVERGANQQGEGAPIV
ncbi:conserved hypothetical protein [Frankia canadensis]|uniref:Uncharacterized protein n=1 Tax=Frankia canadensis TaxID=1836972 RepID=A0A2I2L0L5_9ACTN|nr:hypothetical protein [Frankia canadensis]SNQ51472.1 conserved hypothetical protein [Frankia canadensis]SOU58762.1 conserved hypothetical protein [Frankia canadensis]